MANIWQRHSFRLLLYLEWILLGIALLTAFSWLISPLHPHPHGLADAIWIKVLGISCVALLGVMGLRLPNNSKLIQAIYIAGGFCLSWVAILLLGKGERLFPALLLIVVIRACLLFSLSGRIFVALLAYISFLAVQIMSLMRINFLGIPLGKPVPLLKRLPPKELNGVLLNLAFNSALLFALVLAFVVLLVSAVLAEHQSRSKLLQAHRRLRDYALQVENQATLQERNRIAREIHDSVGHYLTAQSIQLENTALFLITDPTKAQNHLTKARNLGKEALTNIRLSVATLRKNPLQRSLVSIIEQLITEFQDHTNIAIAYQINLVSLLPTEIKTALYRIIQEALTNISKHSQATQVNLSIQEIDKEIKLLIEDNGCGFNLKQNTTGFGLQGIQERTAALQGSLTIVSHPGQGCQINVKIPLSIDGLG